MKFFYSITKQLMHSFSLRLGGHHFLGLTNPDVNRKRMHQLYIVNVTLSFFCFHIQDNNLSSDLVILSRLAFYLPLLVFVTLTVSI